MTTRYATTVCSGNRVASLARGHKLWISTSVLAALAFTLPTAGQAVIQEVVGLAPNDGFGTSFATGDLDGDGVPELIVGAPEGTRSLLGPGYVQGIASDGTVVLLLGGPSGSAAFGSDVSIAPDLDGDGLSDVLVGDTFADAPSATDAGRVVVASSADGSVLFTKAGGFPNEQLGYRVAFLGDVSGDGIPDFAAATRALGFATEPSIHVHSGVQGAELYVLRGPEFKAGDLAGVGDITGDGCADFLTGDGGWGSSGVARLRSGKTGAIVREHHGEQPSMWMGTSVAGVGDLDLDGTPDYAVGAHDYTSLDGSSVGAVYAFSGTDGSQLWRSDGIGSSDNFGWKLDGGQDVDLDGVPDVATASLKRGDVISGATGERIFSHTGLFFGLSVALDVGLLPDRNGDGTAELLLSGITGTSIGGGYATDVGIVQVIGPLTLDCDATGEFDFIEITAGTAPDCNGNKVPDSCDIAGGDSLDLDHTGVPDECEEVILGAPDLISVSTGGTYDMTVIAGPGTFQKTYFIVGSLSGSVPGISVGPHVLPLNPDPWFQFTISHANEEPTLHATVGLIELGGVSFEPAIVLPPASTPGWLGPRCTTRSYSWTEGRCWR